MSRKSIIIQYSVTTGIAAIISLLFLWIQDFFTPITVVEKIRLLADAFTIPGVVMIMIAALIWAGKDGFYDGLGYSMSRVKEMFVPAIRKRHETFYDYKERQRAKPKRSVAFLLFVGLGYVLLAIIFFIIYYCIV